MSYSENIRYNENYIKVRGQRNKNPDTLKTQQRSTNIQYNKQRKKVKGGYKIGHKSMKRLSYADDAILIADYGFKHHTNNIQT